MEEYLKIIALYSGAIVTIAAAIAILFKSSKRFSKWFSTSIVGNADMAKLNGCVGSCKFEKAVSTILDKLDELDHIRLAVKRLEYLTMRQHNEDDEMSINAIYDEYKRLGGNSYIDTDYERWSNRKKNKRKALVEKNN